jgi:hypothetical protein
VAASLIVDAPDLSLVRPLDPTTFIDTVVVGWDYREITQLTRQIAQPIRPPRYLPQEGWISLLTEGRDWWLDDPASLNRMADRGHPIERVRASWPSGFSWPTTDAQPSTGALGIGIEARETSSLYDLGYRIADCSRQERWTALEAAVPLLGLQQVAETIAGHIRLRRRQRGGAIRYSNAIYEWELDLSRLKEAYYRPGSVGFQWPRTDAEAMER